MNTTQQTEIVNDGILRGYTSKETAYKVNDYPVTLLTNYGLELHSRLEKPETVGLNSILKNILCK